jgi:hypothetical protein
MPSLHRIVARKEGAEEESEAVEVVAVGVVVVVGEMVNLLQQGPGMLRQGRRENVP